MKLSDFAQSDVLAVNKRAALFEAALVVVAACAEGLITKATLDDLRIMGEARLAVDRERAKLWSDAARAGAREDPEGNRFRDRVDGGLATIRQAGRVMADELERDQTGGE